MPEKKKRKSLRVLLRVVCAFLVLVLLTAAAFFIIPFTETVASAPGAEASSWMAYLDDSLRLNEIVLPGTHNSATQYCQIAFLTRCQDLGIREQLDAGYRYLDIRLGLEGERLKLMHSFTGCRVGPMPWDEPLYLEEVLAQCYAFLLSNPSETVVFNVKQEHGDETAAEFARALEAVIQKDARFWYTGNALPTLAEARGKLVLLRRYADRSLPPQADCMGISCVWPEQDNDQESGEHLERVDFNDCELWVQDRFHYATEEKWEAFQKGLRASAVSPSALCLHFLSTAGTAKYGHPWQYAKELNQRLLELDPSELRGWIIVDFGDDSIAAHIRSANSALRESRENAANNG